MPTETPNQREKFSEHVTTLFDLRESSIEYDAKVLEKSIDLNKQISQFFERMMFISLGTLALSITSLVSLAAKNPLPAARGVFIYFVIPAWILLLLSIFSARNMMLMLFRSTNHFILQISTLGSTHYKQAIMRTISRMTPLLFGGWPVLGF
jgi:hypothetical protein